MKNYILIGSHGNFITDKSHINELVYGAYNFVVKHTIEESEIFINELREAGKKYCGIFNMNILDKEDVHNSNLLKKLIDEGKAVLSYTYWDRFSPVFVPVKED